MRRRLIIVGFVALAVLTQGCSVLDHKRTQDLYNDAVTARETDPTQAMALFERVKMRTEDAYSLDTERGSAEGPLIDLSGVGAFFGVVTTPEPDLKANSMFMLAESSIQLGDYETAKAAARAGLNEPKAGSVDMVMMRLVPARVIVREVIQDFGQGPAAFWQTSEQGENLRITRDMYDIAEPKLAQAYKSAQDLDGEVRSGDLSLDVQFIPKREMVRLLRQWEILTLSIQFDSELSAFERDNQRIELQRNALATMDIEVSEGVSEPFAFVYCGIRNQIDPRIGPGVSWLRQDVDKRILAGSSSTGRNPCDP